MKHILVTGANGFIGRNLIWTLRRMPETEVIAIDTDSPASELERGLDACDSVVHLAGVNRALKDEDFEVGNVGSLLTVSDGMESRAKKSLIILSSSTQALLDNPYGRSKRRAEQLLCEYSSRTGAPIRVFRLPGVFGKWCRPNYNSVIATFCYNIARGLPIQISDPEKRIEIVHVDDVISAFVSHMGTGIEGASFLTVSPSFEVELGRLADIFAEFHDSRKTLRAFDTSDPLLKRLYGTYLSYLPVDDFSYGLKGKADSRGVLAELLRADGYGQIFVSRTKPGMVRGNHYHDLKVEKFLVLEGQGLVNLRNVATGDRAEYSVKGEALVVVDIPPGWTHSIKNTGTSEMVVLFWASEVFDAVHPDTYAAEV